MDETAPTPTSLTGTSPTPTPVVRPKRSKTIFPIIPVFLLLALLTLATVYFLVRNDNSNNAAKSDLSSKQTATKSSDKKTTQLKTKVGYVTALEGLNLRKEASLNAEILLILPKTTEIEIISTEGDWYFIDAQTKGFVAKEFVSLEKPAGLSLKVFKDKNSPFNFLHPSNYQVKFTEADNLFEYSFTGNQSLGGFKIETTENLTTLGNYSLKNYPSATKNICDIKIFIARKECEKLSTEEEGTIYLVLVETTLYKFSFLKTQGGLLTDLNNLVFPLMVLK